MLVTKDETFETGLLLGVDFAKKVPLRNNFSHNGEKLIFRSGKQFLKCLLRGTVLGKNLVLLKPIRKVQVPLVLTNLLLSLLVCFII